MLLGPEPDPLLSWGYLALLEDSRSICPETGWNPAHLVARKNGKILAAAPMYVRTDSWGDYVFDFQFAEYAEKTGTRFYPRLVGTIPATPAAVWRILGAEHDPSLARACLDAARATAIRSGLAGFNVLWTDPDYAPGVLAPDKKSVEWQHHYFRWENRGYRDIGDMLDSFSANMRRNVRRDREAVAGAGIETCMIHPKACPPHYLELMAQYYDRTNDRFGIYAARFLNKKFFTMLPTYMESGWVLSAAFNKGDADPSALAFLLESRQRLYGRFWGTRDMQDGAVPGLHFEVCFYTPMEYAIQQGIREFDPGMGSEHKARRGFTSFSCSSYHRPFDARMLALMAASLPAANRQTEQGIIELNKDLPFKKVPKGS